MREESRRIFAEGDQEDPGARKTLEYTGPRVCRACTGRKAGTNAGTHAPRRRTSTESDLGCLG